MSLRDNINLILFAISPYCPGVIHDTAIKVNNLQTDISEIQFSTDVVDTDKILRNQKNFSVASTGAQWLHMCICLLLCSVVNMVEFIMAKRLWGVLRSRVVLIIKQRKKSNI